MIDLYTNLFYKARFQMETERADLDLLWNLVLKVRDWLEMKYRQEPAMRAATAAWSGVKAGKPLHLVGADKGVDVEACYYRPEGSQEQYWACQITEKAWAQDAYAPRNWISEIGFEQTEPGRATLSYVVSYSDEPGYYAPCQETPQFTTPRVVKRLLTDPALTCRVGCDRIVTQPQAIRIGEGPAFFDRLKEKDREVAYVLVAPSRQEDQPERLIYPLSPWLLSEILLANAVVCYPESMDFLDEMHYIAGERYACRPGSIRVYLPGLNPEDDRDSYRHRFFSMANLDQWGEGTTQAILRRTLVQNLWIYGGDRMFRLADCRDKQEEERQRRYHQRIKQRAAEEVSEAWDTAEQTVQEMELELQSKEQDARQYRAWLKEAREELSRAKGQLDMQRYLVEQSAAAVQAVEHVRQLDRYPQTCQDIARYFETVFADRLAFSQEGWKSLEDCITKLDILWQALYHMATTLHALYQNQTPEVEKRFRERTGLRMGRGEGATTRQNNAQMRHYFISYEGRTLNIEPHIAVGNRDDANGLRVHFAYDAPSGKLIIGHCGKHLDNATTRKIK